MVMEAPTAAAATSITGNGAHINSVASVFSALARVAFYVLGDEGGSAGPVPERLFLGGLIGTLVGQMRFRICFLLPSVLRIVVGLLELPIPVLPIGSVVPLVYGTSY